MIGLPKVAEGGKLIFIVNVVNFLVWCLSSKDLFFFYCQSGVHVNFTTNKHLYLKSY